MANKQPYSVDAARRQKNLVGYANDADVVDVPPPPSPVDRDLAERHRKLHYRIKRLNEERVRHPDSEVPETEWGANAAPYCEPIDPERARRGVREDPPKPPRRPRDVPPG